MKRSTGLKKKEKFTSANCTVTSAKVLILIERMFTISSFVYGILHENHM